MEWWKKMRVKINHLYLGVGVTRTTKKHIFVWVFPVPVYLVDDIQVELAVAVECPDIFCSPTPP
jgi:hypothetical protein